MANLQRFYLKKDEHTYWTLPVDSSTTAQDVCDAIASKLELRSGSITLLESKLDKNATWEREVEGSEKILAIQSKWNPKKYSQKLVVVKPKIVKREKRNSAHIPNGSDADKFIEDSWKEKAHEEIEVLKREVQVLAESNTELQQQLFEEKQKRSAMKNTSEVVKRLMDAEQQIDDLKLAVSDMHDISSHLETENAQLFHELKEAAHTIGGPYEEKVNAIMQRSSRPPPPPPPKSSPSRNSPSPGPPRVYFEGNRSENSPDYIRKQQDYHNMTSSDFDRHLEVASLGLDFAELQKSQRAREKALEESKQKLREELDLSKQRRSDVLRESNQILLEELEAIKGKSDLSKKKFVDSLHASKKKLEQELDTIEKKRRAQEEVRWSRPMDGFSSTLSPSKQDGFSISPSISPSSSPAPPSRRELFTASPKFDTSSNLDSSSKFGSPSKFDTSLTFDTSKFDSPTKLDTFSKFDSPSKFASPSKFDSSSPSKFELPSKSDSPSKFESSSRLDSPTKPEELTTNSNNVFSSPSYRPSTPNYSSKTDRSTPPSTTSPSPSSPLTGRLSPYPDRLFSTPTERSSFSSSPLFSSSIRTDGDRLSPQLSRFSSLLSK